MLTLYGVYRSRASRPLWVLFETGTPFTHVPVIQAYRLPDPKAADAPLHTATPDFLKVNPQGQIPAMTDGDLTLTESLGIATYIARRYGGPIGPQSDAESALIDQWMLFAATAIETPALEILQAPQGAMGEGITAVAAEKLRRPLARLNAHLSGRDWLLGDRFTVADITVAECTRYAQGHPRLIAEFPEVDRWIKAAQARPAFQKMWAGRMAEPA
jgi:glutathione S-transferase